MQYSPEHIQRLMMEKLAGTISQADDALLMTTIQQHETVRQQWDELQNQLTAAVQNGFNLETDEGAAWARLQPGLKEPQSTKGRVLTLAIKITAAAACLLIIAGAFYFYQRTKEPVLHTSETKPAPAKQPESIILRLANGQVINLSDTGNKTIQAGNATIQNAGNGLSYSAAPSAEQQWNTLYIPSARDYTLTLADGTQVTLNSQTQIRFPFSFPGSTREVYIDGEAFFDVAKNAAKPFIVHTPKTNIRVLGTRFNVNTYDPQKISTSLVEGSVNIHTDSHIAVTLKPGYEAVLNNDNNNFAVAGFDSGETLSWLQGSYYFHNASLQQISKVLERWFDIKVQFKNNTLHNKTFSGVLFKTEQLQVFLDNLHASDAINAELKDNIVYFW